MKTEVRGQWSEVGKRKTEVGSQKSSVFCPPSSALRPLFSAICHPFSVLCHPSSVICLLFSVFCLLFSVSAYANDIKVTNCQIENLVEASVTADIQFDISWDNSWRYGDTFYDAAWIFAKYSVNDGEWRHATISGTTSIGSGTGLTITVPSDNTGAFLYRSAGGTGSLNTTAVQLQWNRQGDGVAWDATKIEIRVFAIEMVYIAQGPFYVGDSDNDQINSFYKHDGSEAITNRTFDTDLSGWTAGTGWAYDSGKAKRTATVGTNDLTHTGLTDGRTYRVIYTVSDYTAGSVTAKAGSGGAGTVKTADGIFSESLTCSGDTLFYLTASDDFAGSVDNVSVHEVCGPYQITSEDAITVGTAVGNLYYDETNPYDGDGAGPIPAAFPKGYNAFYIMKYEISQGQYRDFLNTLTQVEQNARTYDTLTSEDAAGHYVMIGQDITEVAYRQAIKAGPDPADGQPYIFGCDLDADGILNESNDGEWLASNYLSVMDAMAYADWAALRPFSELEFEKAARGPASVVDDEYAWGNTTVEPATSSLTNAGTINETANQGNLNYSSSDPDGPYRCGIYADSGSNRQNAGASFYGVMELSGNLWERPVTIGNTTGRGFIGTHGDGALSSGNANISDWPGWSGTTNDASTGTGLHGGTWDLSYPSYAQVSGRHYAVLAASSRGNDGGGRLARTSP